MVAGDHTWFEQALARLDAVTLDDVERVRRHYLRPENRTVGLYVPAGLPANGSGQ